MTILRLPRSPSTSWTSRRRNYEVIVNSQTNGIGRLVTKDSRFWSVLATALSIVTLGRLSRAAFLRDFATTVGPVQAYPREWEKLDRPMVVHECRHTAQSEFFGAFVPALGWIDPRITVWLGLPLLAVVYLLLPFPIGLAYGRYRLELDADVAVWRWVLRSNSWSPEQVLAHAERRATVLSSSAYAWAWPRFLARRGYRRRARKVLDEFGVVS